MTPKVHFLCLAVAVALSQPLTGAPARASEITTTEVVSLLRDAKIINPANRLTVSIAGREVTIMTKRASKLTDDDCKINAVLMAKTVMASYPVISRVKLMYAVEGSDSCDQVVVRTGDVKSFDSGAVNEEQLLSSLDLQHISGDQLTGATAGSGQVAAGPFRERRLLLLSRIDELKNAGTGIGPFLSNFNKIEDMIKANNVKDAPAALDALAHNLTEQEKLRRQAQKVSAGQGVRGASLQRTSPITASAALSEQDKQWIMQGLRETQKHINFMRDNGVAVSDFESKLRDVESSANRGSSTACQELKSLQGSVKQRCEQAKAAGHYK